ncbi:superoxide dismutase, Cu-Zn family [Paragonimus westermani]|uniref:Superoxide dismutase [Cu-Zn] n=1 Tax=Paragonimus westermani TaxID=34504 RepID=A0A5J4P0F9_9TREM|nr:superoxide dismutase, Cu-Zn family [Paragonimus westermani]
MIPILNLASYLSILENCLNRRQPTKRITQMKAACIITGSTGVKGTVKFTQEAENAAVQVKAQVTGLSPGKHGFHVHTFGDMTNGCVSAGAHFNPTCVDHGGPEDSVRHVGDLGNLVANPMGQVDINGRLKQSLLFHNLFDLRNFRLTNPPQLFLPLKIHALEDDLGRGGHTLSKTTGNAGGRVACGVIGWSE